MKKNLKLTMALFIALILVVNVFMPAMKAFAEGMGYLATISLKDGRVNGSEVTYNVDGTDVVLTLASGVTVDMEHNKQIEVAVDSETGEIDGITVGPTYNGETMQIKVSAEGGFNTNLIVNSGNLKLPTGASIPEEVVTLTIEKKSNNTGGNTQQQTTGNEDIDFDIDFSGVMMNVSILTGNKSVMGGGTDKFVGTIEGAGTTDPTKTNTLEFMIEFGESKTVSEFEINGVVYKEGMDEVVKTINDMDQTPIYTITVPGAEKYTIRKAASIDVVAARTIIWANPGATDIDSEDALIEHGSARIIAVYDENGALVSKNKYTHEGQEYGLDDKNNGWAKIDPGFKVVFEFVPEYGYQLTKVAANEQTLAPQSTTNQYTFTMPDTNVHFAATFTKTEDIVKAESEKVSSGEISLGNTLDGGTAQLTVNDVELSSDKITGFENAAGDYTISNYLDIDLYNVFYKGKADSNDVWSNKIDELDKEATITLKLAEGVNADDIVIVHNIHDGDEYEVIQIDSYDAETNTITFKTKSFSNYAIATKASATTDTKSSSNPKTGDIIAAFIAIFAVSTVGFIVTKSAKKRV